MIKPVYTTLKGWRQSTAGIAEYDKLPQAARDYLAFQERESEAKIGMISTGPDRDHTIVLPEFAAALDRICVRNSAVRSGSIAMKQIPPSSSP